MCLTLRELAVLVEYEEHQLLVNPLDAAVVQPIRSAGRDLQSAMLAVSEHSVGAVLQQQV